MGVVSERGQVAVNVVDLDPVSANPVNVAQSKLALL